MQSKKNKFCIQYLSLDICLLLTKITRDFYIQKLIFYRQFLIGYSFANCTVYVSFCVEYITGVKMCTGKFRKIENESAKH